MILANITDREHYYSLHPKMKQLWDYILTHEPPASLKDCLGVDVFQRIEVHAFFEDIIKTVKYEKWFFGKCHIDKHIPLKFYAVFNTVTPLIK